MPGDYRKPIGRDCCLGYGHGQHVAGNILTGKAATRFTARRKVRQREGQLTPCASIFHVIARVHLPERKCHAEPAAAAKHLAWGTSRPQTLRYSQGDIEKTCTSG